jgi:hypothetical protein
MGKVPWNEESSEHMITTRDFTLQYTSLFCRQSCKSLLPRSWQGLDLS